MEEGSLAARLFAMQETSYGDFQARLMPNVEREKIIGIRTPSLRAFAKEFAKTQEAEKFMQSLPHFYYEENNLHAFLIEYIKDYDECVFALERFLPFVDNWATCDSMSPKVLKKHPERLIEDIKRWMASQKTYTVRFGMETLMRYFLDENFKQEYLDLAAKINSEEYYINMMQAWFFATALAKRYEEALPYIENRRLPKWSHNRAIQKAVESFRITNEQKNYLKTLKIK